MVGGRDEAICRGCRGVSERNHVEPSHRGEGIGTALLEHGLDLLPETITALKLEIISGNEVGAVFYEARDFVKTGGAEVDTGGLTFGTVLYTLRL